MRFQLSHALIFSGTAICMCATMTMLTPKFVQSLSEIRHLGGILITFDLLGILLFLIGIHYL